MLKVMTKTRLLLANTALTRLLFSAVAVIAASVQSSLSLEIHFFPTTDEVDKQPYTTWLNGHASSYDHHKFLSTAADPNAGMAAFWTVDGDDFRLAFATMAIGWAAVGIAEAGGMFGADVISFTAATEQLVDGYILDERQVLVDDSQDWTLTSSTVDDGWIIVEATRKLSTGDTQDHVIRNDKDLTIAPTRFIAAWGDSESISYHGENKARTSLRIFADPSSSSSSESEALLEVISESTDGYFDVLEDGYEIPKSDTTYRENCKTYNELKNQFGIKSDLTMIAVTPVITEETRAFIHHFTVYLVPDCKAKDFSKEMIYGWAPGAEGAFTTPEDVGIPMFDSESNQAIQVEIHYNNPKLISGMKDSSGVRIHYTNTPRLHKAGVLMVGDPFIGLDGEGINDGLTKHEFTCPGTCSWLFLDGPVTVFEESLHMHKTGVRMVNEVIREGDVFHTASVEVYDFDQQGRFVNCQPLTILFSSGP